MVKRAIVLKHVASEGPGRIGELLTSRGYELDVRELQRGDAVPSALAQGALLVVMGGPMGVGDVAEPRFPFLRAELELLARCVDDDAPVLGVCLGAQLLAAAAGARVEPMRGPDGNRVYEIGWASVSFLGGDVEPVLAGLPERAPMLHWHGDTFELPRDGRRLAASEICENQAFALGSRLFGLQFHPEVDAQTIDDFLQADAELVERALGDGADARIRRETQRHLRAFRSVGDRLLNNVLDALTELRRPSREA
jgi:GMP synthase (glutamine-hydrolysing)